MSEFVDINNIKFILHEVLDVNQLTQYERFEDYDQESFDLILDGMKDFAEKEMYPLFREMDEQAAYYDDGKIIVHPGVGMIMEESGNMGAIGTAFDYEDGGLQLPNTINTARAHIAECANNNLTGYTGLTTGAAELIVEFGTQELKDTYVPKMLEGKWAGTMCLTEPQAGSSLSDITTSATPQGDGSYKIKGQKIFISGGDHEYCENFVHLVLARIDGAPAGTKGISLFVVPKKRITEDGGLESNDVTTAGDFQKLGQKGYCTTHLVFGENNDSYGWLIGMENKGLKNMFLMMNGARIAVGVSAASIATAAYHASLQYARERPQGRRILTGGQKNINQEQALIIEHPDVRRMLLLQKAVSEGAVSLIFQASIYRDLVDVTKGDEKEKYKLLLELLTPMVKTYPSEMGQVSVSTGLQILGGYGFCEDFVLQQYYRDIRIMSLYEGTTGIQSLDLLARKVVAANGDAMKHYTAELIATIKAASNHSTLKAYADQMTKASKKLEETTLHLLQYAMKGDHERYISDATIYMEMMSTITIAWQWLKMAVTAQENLDSDEKELSHGFYKAKITTMKFYFKYELSKIYGLSDVLMSDEVLTILEKEEIEF